MPSLDEFLKNELRRTVRPVDVNDVSSRIDVRRIRRARVRKVQTVALAVIVIAGTLGGVAVLSDVFRKEPRSSVGNASPFPIVPKVNGAIVAAQQLRGGPLRLVSMNPDGSALQAIQARVAGDPWLPAWSPDGAKLAVAVFPFDGPRAIWVMDADGANAVKIAEGDNVSQPSWSPDGSEIALAVDTKQGSSIHIMNQDGSGDRVIGDTIQGKDYFTASFSPDGTRLAFDKGTDSGFGIFVMNVDGSDVRRISTGTSDYSPSWSPDGTRIVFTRQEQGAESDIYVMDADGSNVNRLTNDGQGVTNLDAEFSPDGARIAYVAGVTGGPGSVVVMNADGTHPVTILNDGVLGISWQPLPSTATPAPAVADLGLGFRLCDVQSMAADFDGNGSPDTAFLASKMSDVGGCPTNGTDFEVLEVDLTADGLADVSYGPLRCATRCRAFGTPDLDGDGRADIAIIQQDRPVDFITTYRLEGSTLTPFVVTDGSGTHPLVIASGEVRGGPSPSVAMYLAGAFCQSPNLSTYRLAIWTADQNPDGTYESHQDRYVFRGSIAEKISQRDDLQLDASKVAPGGGPDTPGCLVHP